MVEAVVYGVDVAKPPAPARPLTITYPTLSKRRHPTTLDKQTVAEVEVLYLMLTCCYGINDILVLTDEGKGRTSGGDNSLPPTLQKMPDNTDKLI